MQHTFDEVLVSAMDNFKHSSTYVDEVSGTIEPYTIPVAAHDTIVFFYGSEQQNCTIDNFDLALEHIQECLVKSPSLMQESFDFDNEVLGHVLYAILENFIIAGMENHIPEYRAIEEYRHKLVEDMETKQEG